MVQTVGRWVPARAETVCKWVPGMIDFYWVPEARDCW